jgi:hypothetical protein
MIAAFFSYIVPKHYLFPKVYISVVVASLAFIPLDAWFTTFVLPNEPMFDPETIKEFSRTLLSGLIWVPYMLVSKRVKTTFVERPPNKPIQSHTEDLS